MMASHNHQETKKQKQLRRKEMTLFTKLDCELCERLKEQFDLSALKVDIEVLDKQNAGALAHLAWHGLVDTARKRLPILVLDDSSALSEYADITAYLAAVTNGGRQTAPHQAYGERACQTGMCTL